jgi:hypothetical protein
MGLGVARHSRGGGSRWSWHRRDRCLNDGRSWRDRRELVDRMLRPDTGVVRGWRGHRSGHRCDDVGQRSWHRDSTHDGFENIDRLDGQPWYRTGQHTVQRRPDNGRQAGLRAGVTIR